MAWVKVLVADHPIYSANFLAAVPEVRGVRAIPMFGGIAAVHGGHRFGGLLGRAAIVRRSDAKPQIATPRAAR